MKHIHLTAPTRLVDVNGDQFAYRRWGNATTDEPPLFFLQHFLEFAETPRPDEGGLSAFLKSVIGSSWGTFRTRRLRARA